MRFQIAADPHPWPRRGQGEPRHCALLVVDMQNDYCSTGFYIQRAGYALAGLQAPIEPIKKVLAAARQAGMEVVFTRHASAHVPAEGMEAKSGTDGAEAYPTTAARGEPGWHIIEALSPARGELIVDKTTISAFLSTDLDAILRSREIRQLAICGNTIDVCVHSTLRTAVDLGYECLLLADCCGAVEEGLHAWSVASAKIEDGVFGTVADSTMFVQALTA